jgi:hypothetical protein
MGHFTLPEDQGKSIVVQIINMGGGGIFFTLRSNRDIQLKIGDKLFFENIINKDSKSFSLQMDVIIVWIVDDPGMEFTGIGTKFLKLNPELEIKVKACIEHCQ